MDRAAEAEFIEFMHSRWLQLLRLGFVLWPMGSSLGILHVGWTADVGPAKV